MSMRDESAAYVAGKQAHRKHPEYIDPRATLIAAGLPVTEELCDEVQKGFDAAKWEVAWYEC